MRITEKQPDVRTLVSALRKRHFRLIRRAGLVATHETSVSARKRVQDKVRSVGLGKLANAIGQTSALREKNTSEADKPYGVIYVRGGDDTLAGGALEAYGQGALITPQQGQWLAFPTSAVPKYVNMGGRRLKITPQIYNASGLVSRIGKLIFRQINAKKAVLLVERVTVSPKDGRALRDRGGRVRTRVRQDAVVAFILIRDTRRSKRFDKDTEIAPEAAKVPDLLMRELRKLAPDDYV